jgi:peptide/nickel transport system permease protein
MQATSPTSATTPSGLLSRWRKSRKLKVLTRNPQALLGATMVLFFLVVGLLAPVFAPPTGDCLRDLTGSAATPAQPQHLLRAAFAPPQSCTKMPKLGIGSEPTPPSSEAPFGTVNGYDIRYGIVWGARSGIIFGTFIVLSTLFLGLVVGIASGYYGGWFDSFMMRVTDVIFAFPSLIFSIALAAIIGRNMVTLALSFILVGWAVYARMVRAEVLRAKTLEYVEASRALGTGSLTIMFRHILPNVTRVLMVSAILDMGSVPLLMSSLAFLGIGVLPGYADWGTLLQAGQLWIQGPPGQPIAYWYVSFFPALTLLLYTLGWNLLGDALQDSMDVKAH